MGNFIGVNFKIHFKKHFSSYKKKDNIMFPVCIRLIERVQFELLTKLLIDNCTN